MGGRTQRGAESVFHNPPQLHSLVKRDPESYRDDFLRQYRHYESARAIFSLRPSDEAKSFEELIIFISHVIQFIKLALFNYAFTLKDCLGCKILSRRDCGVPST